MVVKKQLCWEDVEIGGEVTPLPKISSSQMLVKWAGASGDFNPLHYEDRKHLLQKFVDGLVLKIREREFMPELHSRLHVDNTHNRPFC